MGRQAQRRQCSALRLLLHVLVLTLVKLHVRATAYGNASGAHIPAEPGSTLPRARIAIVNERCFHLEVVAGLVGILEPQYEVTVYLHSFNMRGRRLDFGFLELIRAHGLEGRVLGLPTMLFPHYDVIIFVSPEYRPHYVREFIHRSKPKLVVLFVHNGDAQSVPELLKVHSNAHLMTLSPHVQQYVSNRLGRPVKWMLPLMEVKPRTVTRACNAADCLGGFAIQGALDSKRRNYTYIFNQLDSLINSSAMHKHDKRLAINVVGSGGKGALTVPSHLQGRVRPHRNLRYNDFYTFISTNLALIPALASTAYYDRKFSSTLITSLVTGVPVIVDERFMKAYSFLSDKQVAQQGEGEEIIHVMQRILTMSVSELKAMRSAIADLREDLSKRARQMLQAMIEPIEQRMAAEQQATQQQQRDWDAWAAAELEKQRSQALRGS